MKNDIAKVEKVVERAGHSLNEWRLFADELSLYESEFWIKMFLANPTKAFVGFMNWRVRKKEEQIKGVPGAE